MIRIKTIVTVVPPREVGGGGGVVKGELCPECSALHSHRADLTPDIVEPISRN